jgi:hypothetical protein
VEKNQQIDQMGAIYSSAQLTIIAAAGTGPSFGLSGISRGRRLLASLTSAGTGHLKLHMGSVYEHIPRSLWASRAWSKHLPIVYRPSKG